MQVMGVVNVTDDSFSDGGRYLDSTRAIEHAFALAADGADIIDIGGESTRPGAVRIDEAVEIARILPVVKEVAAQGITVSIDTMHWRTEPVSSTMSAAAAQIRRWRT